MGNVLLQDQTDAQSAVAFRIYESSDANILQAQVQARIDALIAAGNIGILDINIAGAGDGHAFVVTVVTSTGIAAPAADTQVTFFTGSDQATLEANFNAAFASLAGARSLLGFGMDGTSLGKRFMGLMLHRPPIA